MAIPGGYRFMNQVRPVAFRDMVCLGTIPEVKLLPIGNKRHRESFHVHDLLSLLYQRSAISYR
jgi:hypothetical protein